MAKPLMGTADSAMTSSSSSWVLVNPNVLGALTRLRFVQCAIRIYIGLDLRLRSYSTGDVDVVSRNNSLFCERVFPYVNRKPTSQL